MLLVVKQHVASTVHLNNGVINSVSDCSLLGLEYRYWTENC